MSWMLYQGNFFSFLFCYCTVTRDSSFEWVYWLFFFSFVAHHIPSPHRDYTELPPSDIGQVKRNHAMLLWLLGSFEDQFRERGKEGRGEEEEGEETGGNLLPFLRTREKYEECQTIIAEFVRGVTCEVYEKLNVLIEVGGCNIFQIINFQSLISYFLKIGYCVCFIFRVGTFG